ncbi:MAG TPA: hypothetical protein VG826_24835 [Pirellulales bacterium]|nr:hypothetical protein [Pirellulales bacterium]
MEENPYKAPAQVVSPHPDPGAIPTGTILLTYFVCIAAVLAAVIAIAK